MQGQRGVIGSESLEIEHGSASGENRNPPTNTISGYVSPTNAANQESRNVSTWSMGESISSFVPNGSSHMSQSWVELKTEHEWSHHYEPPASMLSLGDVNMSIRHNHANNGHHHGPLFVQNSHPESVTVNPTSFKSNASSSSSDPFELEARQLPCKRKAVELSIGQSSSGSGSGVFPANPTPSDQIIPRLGLGVGTSSENPIVENSHRNVRLRINSSRQQEPPPVAVATTQNSANQEGQPALRLPVLRRNLQASSRWNRSSNRSSNLQIFGDNSRTIPTNISDHPIFIQPNETRPTSQNAVNWSSSGAAASVRGVTTSALPNLAAHYPSRRLTDILRQSLLLDSMAGGGQNSNLFSRIPPPVGTSQDVGMPPVVGDSGHHHPPQSRPSDRQLNVGFGLPYLSRSMVAGNEGRGRLVSEIRNVLDLIRRGEGLRFEDFMILDRTVFYGMADVHDRHRDMRLDIDNMSYEELLALEERIGNVNTGLTEQTISSCLKPKTFVAGTGEPDAKPCCICQEEYKNGDDLGALECGHDFHTSCIKQWLLQKNSCPVCKSTALTTPK